jgi:mRNA interferase RelE/StbE
MYQVEFTEGAAADLARLDKPIAQRVLRRLRWLAENLEAITPEALTGQWQEVFKLRVGDYRVENYNSFCQASSRGLQTETRALAKNSPQPTVLCGACEK